MGENNFTSRPSSFGNKNSLRNRVRRIIDQEIADYPDNFEFIGLEHVVGPNAKPSGGDQSQSNCCLRFCWAVLILTCVVTCVYQTWDRISYYYTYPTYLSVVIEQRRYITYPPVTLCVDPGFTMRTRKKMAEKYGTEPCSFLNVDLIDFNLTGKQTTPERLWNSQLSALGKIIRVDDLINIRFQIPSVELQPMNLIDTPFGNCIQDKTVNESVLYGGTLTALIYGTNGRPGCGLPQVLIGAKGHYLDPSTARPFPLGLMVGLPIKKQEHVGLSTPINPCVSEEEYWDCIIPCFEKLMADNIECRLSYMVNVTKPSCTTSPDARKAHKLAIKFMRNKYLDQNCGCTKRCNVTTYLIRLETIADYPPVLVIYYPTSFVEVSIEKSAYDFDKLVCDVGGSLGLFLGFCVLSLVDSVQLIADLLLIKLCPKPKKRVNPLVPSVENQMSGKAKVENGNQMQPNFKRTTATSK